MKDKKHKKDEHKEKINFLKIPKFDKNILEPFSEIISAKYRKFSLNSKSKNSKTSSKVKLPSSKLMFAIQKNLIRRHSSSLADYNDIIIDNLIYNKNCHLVSVFKDYMITDYIDEFLKRIYRVNESVERVPKIANYYKNYLKFFCNPVFRDFKINNIIQSYGDFKAELYYNNNYGGKKRDKEKTADDNIRNIFNTTVKENIDRNSLTKSEIRADTSIFETEMNYKPTLNNFGLKNYYADGFSRMVDFNDEHSTMRSHLLTVKSKEESILNLLSSLENNNKYYIDKSNEKVIKEFENKIIGKEAKSANSAIEKDIFVMTKTFKKPSTTRAKSEKINHIEDTHTLRGEHNHFNEYNHVKHPSLNRPPSSLKLHLNEFKNIKLSKNTNNFLNNQLQPGHTKNSSSHPSHDFLQTTMGGKSMFPNNPNSNTPLLNRNSNLGNKLYQSTSDVTRLKKKPESRLSSHNTGSTKISTKTVNIFNENKPDKRVSASEIHGNKHQNIIQQQATVNNLNNLNNINDIMKITLSLCVDKSSRNRPLSNQMINTHSTGNNMLTNPLTGSISNFNFDGTKRGGTTTIINKVDNINNFNININNQINLPDNIQSSLLNTLPLQISTKNTPNNQKETLTNILEKNKLLSRTRNKDNNIYKMPSNSIRTSQLEDDNKKKTFYKDSKDVLYNDGRLFSSYNTGKIFS
jgi:hypothetical protein